LLNPPNADISKYYKYHHNNGHTIDECKALQDKIEELILFTHLKRLVKREDKGNSRTAYKHYDNRRDHKVDKNRNDKREEATPQGDNTTSDRPPLKGTINTISYDFGIAQRNV